MRTYLDHTDVRIVHTCEHQMCRGALEAGLPTHRINPAADGVSIQEREIFRPKAGKGDSIMVEATLLAGVARRWHFCWDHLPPEATFRVLAPDQWVIADELTREDAENAAFDAVHGLGYSNVEIQAVIPWTVDAKRRNLIATFKKVDR